MITFIYVVLVFLILRFSVTLFNFLSNPKLGKYGKHFTDKVTIIITPSPDKKSLKLLLKSIREQDYEQIEVLVSTANNQEEIDTAAQNCDYLLFLDAHTTIRSGLINSLIYRVKVFDLALLSIIPDETTHSFLEKCMLPVKDFVLLNLVPLRLIRLLPGQVFAVASDKCMFFNAALYRNHGWNAGRDIIKMIKAENFKVETLLGNRLISISSSYHSSGLLNQSGKDLLLSFGNNTIAALLYLVLVIAGPIIMLANYEYALLIMPVGLIFLTRVMISFLVRQNPLLNVLLHPVQMIMLFIALSKAVFIRIFM